MRIRIEPSSEGLRYSHTMKVKANSKYLRIAPRKVRLLADLIRGKKTEEALALLGFSLKRGSKPLKKLIQSAIANAKNNFQLDEKNLWISELRVDEGPKLKRWRARARGRAAQIQKKTSHITLVLEGEKKKEESKKKERKITKTKEEKEEKSAKEKSQVKRPDKKIGLLKDKIDKSKIFRRKAI